MVWFKYLFRSGVSTQLLLVSQMGHDGLKGGVAARRRSRMVQMDNGFGWFGGSSREQGGDDRSYRSSHGVMLIGSECTVLLLLWRANMKDSEFSSLKYNEKNETNVRATPPQTTIYISNLLQE